MMPLSLAALVSAFHRDLPMGRGDSMTRKILKRLLADEQAQDIAEYAVMLPVILGLVVGIIRLVGSNANNAFSAAASSSR
jgi:Flp pilus assembly pilin Flp